MSTTQRPAKGASFVTENGTIWRVTSVRRAGWDGNTYVHATVADAYQETGGNRALFTWLLEDWAAKFGTPAVEETAVEETPAPATHLMVSSPRGTLTHLSRHGELTLCSRLVPATWSAEPVTAERIPTCRSCAAWAGSAAREAQADAAMAARYGDNWRELAVEEQPATQELPVDRAPLTLLVVPCSGAKLDQPAPARELYRGTLTTMGLAACSVIVGSAEMLTGHAGVQTMILSALHGLLELDTVVAPYDVTMGDPASITTAALAQQLRASGATRVVALTPNGYTDALAAACELAGVQLVRAFAGCRGIGDQRGRLAQLRRSGGYGAGWGLETRRMVQEHTDALAEDRARTAAGITTDDQLRERFAHLGAERVEQIVRARNQMQAELASPEFVAAAARVMDAPDLPPYYGRPIDTPAGHRWAGETPSANCATGSNSGRRAALRNAASRSGQRLAAAVQRLPPAGTPAPC